MDLRRFALNDNDEYMTQFGATARVRNLRLALRLLALLFAGLGIAAAVFGATDRWAVVGMAVAATAVCLLLAKYPGLFAPRKGLPKPKDNEG